jgi:exodeoxyribonuclease VII small subunit
MEQPKMAMIPADTPPDSSPEKPSAAPSFEQTLTRLEEMIHLLEEGKIGLDEALARYEEGVGLLRKAYELLEKAQRQISLLSGVDSEGNPLLRPMEVAASFSLERDIAGPAAAAETRGKAAGRRGKRSVDQDLP